MSYIFLVTNVAEFSFVKMTSSGCSCYENVSEPFENKDKFEEAIVMT